MAIRGYWIFQRILNVNGARAIPWPVHFTSRVSGKITLGDMVSPGMMPGCYINAMAGIEFGSNVWIGPGSKIISANHDPADLECHLMTKPIRIGSNVWIGANAIILPNVEIGNNVIIGAGSVVTRDIPDCKVAVGNPARVIKENKVT
ncbi:sugar O-acetyltransferase [Methylobacillus caricis]|uniref:DapH/DapD/GlmU-related protein n=1 Tax=Methylobacillus caricis TaxID=1971611 RepID=UPI001CFF6979|nr:DapH/DapD/GlmU-related protein [Methylobacillus caricis]MCB5187695.1 sugar O-acetyltransferase [Methylobacillus caricis]